MSRQSRPNYLHFVVPDFQNGGEEEAGHLNRPITSIAPVITEHQSDINTRSAIQIAHRLAIIGDELNQIYRWNFQNRLVRFARTSLWRMAASVCQLRVSGILKSVMKGFTRLVKNNSTQRIVAYGGDWVSTLAPNNVCCKVTLTFLFAAVSGMIMFELCK